MQSIAEEHSTVKNPSEFSGPSVPQTLRLAGSISSSDRRLLLAASFRLFLRRLNHGFAVRRDDLLRLADFAESDVEKAA
jgi:hypothetical protein